MLEKEILRLAKYLKDTPRGLRSKPNPDYTKAAIQLKRKLIPISNRIEARLHKKYKGFASIGHIGVRGIDELSFHEFKKKHPTLAKDDIVRQVYLGYKKKSFSEEKIAHIHSVLKNAAEEAKAKENPAMQSKLGKLFKGFEDKAHNWDFLENQDKIVAKKLKRRNPKKFEQLSREQLKSAIKIEKDKSKKEAPLKEMHPSKAMVHDEALKDLVDKYKGKAVDFGKKAKEKIDARLEQALIKYHGKTRWDKMSDVEKEKLKNKLRSKLKTGGAIGGVGTAMYAMSGEDK